MADLYCFYMFFVGEWNERCMCKAGNPQCWVSVCVCAFTMSQPNKLGLWWTVRFWRKNGLVLVLMKSNMCEITVNRYFLRILDGFYGNEFACKVSRYELFFNGTQTLAPTRFFDPNLKGQFMCLSLDFKTLVSRKFHLKLLSGSVFFSFFYFIIIRWLFNRFAEVATDSKNCCSPRSSHVSEWTWVIEERNL